MFDAAAKALAQIVSPAMRAILWKSIGLALILIVLLGIALHRALLWLATAGEGWAESALGAAWNTPLNILLWVVSFATGLGILFGSVLLMPAVTSFVASFFVDDIAGEVERTHYPADGPGHEVPLARSVWEGLKAASLSVLLYLFCLPFLLFAGLGLVMFFLVTAFLLSREYFELAAMRYRPADEAKRLRKQHAGTVFAAGLLIALFVSIPIVNLATPLFGMALMVHMHKRLSGRRTELIEPRRT